MFKLIGKKYVLALTALVAAAAISFAGVNLLSSDETSTELGAPGVVAANFLEGSLTKAITTEDCTLSDGTDTTCYRIEVTSELSKFTPAKAMAAVATSAVKARTYFLTDSLNMKTHLISTWILQLI